eukprot:jgi/Orpsp1_1/1179048/evm.model.c7180000067718.1
MFHWYLIIFFLYIIILSGYSNGIILNAIAYSLDEIGIPFISYVDEFNKYAKENNIDINIQLNLMTRINFTMSIDSSVVMFETLLKKKNNKYDIYFFDNSYTKIFQPYLLDLNKKLPDDHINMYDKNILSQVCRYQNKLIGLPISLDFSVLYSNKKLLDKYHKKIPNVWDELIETGKEILEKERALNNTELIGYNGFFPDYEHGICTVHEFIYSCRESYESPLPNLTSQTTVEAIKLLKRIKEEISSDEIFTQKSEYSENKLYNGEAIFIKHYKYFSMVIDDDSPYVITKMPGIKEGISGSILVGYNVGIDNSIDKMKEKSAVEVIKIMTSKNFQKNLTLKNIITTSIPSLYYDEDVCNALGNCELYRNIQVIGKPTEKADDFNNYSEKFMDYFNEYLFGNETELNTLKYIDDLLKIYYINIFSDDTSVGLIFTISSIVLFTIIALSIPFLYIKRYKNNYIFLSKKLWIMVMTGILMILSSGFFNIGKPIDIRNIFIDKGENFQICSLDNTLVKIIVY